MEKIWLKSYDPGIPYTINPDQYTSMVEMAEESFECYLTNICYSNLGVNLSYQDTDRLSKCFAGFLQVHCGMKKGDRLAIMLPNILQYPIAMFGAVRAGIIVVNLNPFYTPRELKAILQDSGATGIVILENFAHTLEQVIAETEIKSVIVTEIGDLFGFTKRHLVNFTVKYIKKMIPKWNIPGYVRFRKALSNHYLHAFHKVAIDSSDLAYIQYTGGTTGEAKGAMLTHRNMVSNLLQISVWMDSFFKRKFEGGVINALPLYHIFSLTANCLVFLRVGFANILITNPKDVNAFVKELKRQPFSVILGVNTLFNLLLTSKEFLKLNFAYLKFCLGGGMALQKNVADRWKEVTGISLIEGYGLTEASPVVTVNPFTMKTFNGSIGLPVPSTDIKICDEEGKEVPFGERGELWIKGPQIMKGYWNKPEKTKKVLTEDGWLRTGDIVTIDEKGFIRLVDRKNDVINVSGFNVYPTEVEEVIASIEGVYEVAVVGVSAGAQGQMVKAYIVRNNPDLTAEEIIRECRKNLTNYKVPHEIEFRESLPKTTVGKILRKALREEAEKKEGS